MHNISITAVSRPANGTPAMASPMPAQPGLNHSGHADAQRHAADGLSGQSDGVLAVDARQAAPETVHRQCR